ncbi:DUF1294-domain-containing protein [Thozetella sp. PMI_491]|nr:DUF1294-domain-containing protein [Thozetella sp. PMI_491]
MPRSSPGRSNVTKHNLILGARVLSLVPLGIGLGLLWRAGVPQPLPYCLTVSVSSFLLYGYDKYQARKSHWRVREVLLHLLDLLGGWPGGLLAQRLFRHKTRKTSFQIIFWGTVLVHDIFWLRWMLS